MMPEQQQLGDYPELAAVVDAALKRNNLSEYRAHINCNVSRGSISKLLAGHRVEIEVLEKLARCLGEDVNEWRRLAGFKPVSAFHPLGPAAVSLILNAMDLAEEFEYTLRMQLTKGQQEALTDESVDAIVEDLRRQLERSPRTTARALDGAVEIAPGTSHADPQHRLAAGLATLSERYQTATWESQGGTHDLTDEKVDQILEWVEQKLQQEEERGR